MSGIAQERSEHNSAAATPDAKIKKSWRDVLPVHPAAELFPMMSQDELIELGNDIKANGMRAPIVVWSKTMTDGKVFLLDGRNRLAAMEAVGIPFASVISKDLYDDSDCPPDPYKYVISANLLRRHLTAEQRRELIAKLLKAKPEESNRQIAKQVKVNDKTVAKVRTELEATAEIPQLEKTVGRDGKARPAKSASRFRRTTEEIRCDTLLGATVIVASSCEALLQVDLPERLTAAQVNKAVQQLEEAEGYLREAKSKIFGLRAETPPANNECGVGQ